MKDLFPFIALVVLGAAIAICVAIGHRDIANPKKVFTQADVDAAYLKGLEDFKTPIKKELTKLESEYKYIEPAVLTNRSPVSDLYDFNCFMAEVMFRRGAQQGQLYTLEYYLTNHQSFTGMTNNCSQQLWYKLTNKFPLPKRNP